MNARRHPGGQALVEFLVVLPIILLLVFATLQAYVALEKRQKAAMHLWLVLRGASYDYVHNDVSKDDVQTDVTHAFAPGDQVTVRVSELIQGKGQKSQAWETSADVFLGMLSLINPLDFSLLRQASIEVKSPNPFAGLRLPFLGTGFGRMVDTDEMLHARAEGVIWTSWTSMANVPDYTAGSASLAAGEKLGKLAKKAGSDTKDVESRLRSAIGQAEKEERSWQDRAARDRKAADDPKNAKRRDDLLADAEKADQQAQCWAREAAALRQELNAIQNHGGADAPVGGAACEKA